MVRVERSFPAPESLVSEKEKTSGTYNTPEVNRRLSHDFHGKCYICEAGDLQDPQIEHLLPHMHGRYRDRMFDWENLFWSCGRCNSIKKSSAYDEGILDCCRQDPEEYLIQYFLEGQVLISSRRQDEIPVIERTIKLLNEVYNKTNTGMREVTCQQRINSLCREMNAFYKSLEEYQQNKTSTLKEKTVKAFLSRTSSYSAFKREYIRMHQESYPELMDVLSN